MYVTFSRTAFVGQVFGKGDSYPADRLASEEPQRPSAGQARTA
jgi:hypothetical protein